MNSPVSDGIINNEDELDMNSAVDEFVDHLDPNQADDPVDATATDTDNTGESDISDGDGPEDAPDERPAEADGVGVMVDYEGKNYNVADLVGAFSQKNEMDASRQHFDDYRAKALENIQFAEQSLNNITANLQALIPAEPGEDLRNSDYTAWLTAKDERERAIAELNNLMQPVQQAMQPINNQNHQDHMEREKNTLFRLHPELTDPNKAQEFQQGVTESAQVLGFSADELASFNDARVLSAIYYAGLGKKAEAGTETLKSRGVPATRGTGKPAVGNSAARSRFIKQPTMENAMNLNIG